MIQDLQHIHNKEMLSFLLDYFKLSDAELKCETKRMSLGVKRKLAIVLAFMSDPDLLILDEPTSGLDIVMQEKFIDFIIKEKNAGKTILLSSHIFSEVDATCDRIAIIKDGHIVSEFKANDLKHTTLKYYEITFNTKGFYDKFILNAKETKIFKILNSDAKECKVLISSDDKDINEVIKFLDNYRIKYFTNIKETLKDYFMKYYKEDLDFKTGAL